MKKQNPFIAALAESAAGMRMFNICCVLAVSAVFPIVEGVFVNLWTSTPTDQRAPFAIALVVVALLHVMLIAFTVVSSAQFAPAIIANAAMISDELHDLKLELARRERAYRLVRRAFETLNTQTCIIDVSADESGEWCTQGFRKCVEPVLMSLANQAADALGVAADEFTLELYYEPGIAPRTLDEEVDDGLLRLEWSHPTSMSVIDPNDPRSPARLVYNSDTFVDQHISQNPQYYMNGNDRKRDVYFTRFAGHPIALGCGPVTVGALIVTSKQDGPFAPDAQEIMAFFASILANLQYRYDECVRSRAAKAGQSDVAIKNQPAGGSA